MIGRISSGSVNVASRVQDLANPSDPGNGISGSRLSCLDDPHEQRGIAPVARQAERRGIEQDVRVYALP